MDKLDKEYGHLKICLSELMAEKGLNRNQVSIKAAMNWKQVNLCTALECNIQDLLLFIPAENMTNG